jgi:DnaD/phage-associated family protein
MPEKTIFRINKDKENPYVMLDKRCINREDLSFKAKGIWAYLMSKPDTWTVMFEDIVKHSADGKDSVRAGLKELEDAGYIVKSQERNQDGTFSGYTYTVFETPNLQPFTEKPFTEKPFTEKPFPENPPLLINDLNKNNLNNNNDSVKAAYNYWLQNTGDTNTNNIKTIAKMVEMFSQHQAELDQQHVDKYRNPADVVIQAMGIAVSKGILRLAYVDGILKSWEKDGTPIEQSKSYVKTPKQKRKPKTVEWVDIPTVFDILKD